MYSALDIWIEVEITTFIKSNINLSEIIRNYERGKALSAFLIKF